MLFNSYIFLLAFLPATLALFIGVRRLGWFRASLVVLVGASLTFYAYWRFDHFALFLLTVVGNFYLARAIARRGPLGRLLTVLGVVANMGILVGFKYTGFLVENFHALSGEESSIVWDVVLPLGISFYTFQQVAYLLDSYRDGQAEESFWEYALFVSFFPQLIAGPIVHHRTTRPQFTALGQGRVDTSLIPIGFVLLVMGLSKKVLLADNLALAANPIFEASDAGAQLSGGTAWLGSVAYSLQIYFDFSGYSDIAVGLGLLFGVHLPINFNSPYRSNSIIEFWQRWHITLSTWLRDYVYIPLGGNRSGEVLRLRNIFLTMLIGGIWHGAGWTFVLWGALHGFYITTNHLLRKFVPAAEGPSPLRTVLSRATTLTTVMVAWVFFRSTTLDGALNVVKAMFGGSAAVTTAIDTAPIFYVLLLVGAGLALLSPNSMELVGYSEPESKHGARRPSIARRPRQPSFKLAVVAGGLLALVFASIWRPSTFIYFNF